MITSYEKKNGEQAHDQEYGDQFFWRKNSSVSIIVQVFVYLTSWMIITKY